MQQTKITYLCDTNLRELIKRVEKLYERDPAPRVISVLHDGDEFIAVLEWKEEER